jgi:hypothetical protein
VSHIGVTKSEACCVKPDLVKIEYSYQRGIAYNGLTYEGNGRGKKESRLRRLLKSRRLCFKTMCSRGITEVIYLTASSVSHCPRLSRHSLAGVQLSTNGTCSFLWQEGAKSALFFSPPDTSRLPQQQASGVALTLLHWSPPLTLSKDPGVALKSQR